MNDKLKIDLLNLNEVETKIYNSFAKLVKDYFQLEKEHKSVKWLTRKLKIHIGEIGYNLKFDVASSEHNGEWLYDLVWYTDKDDFIEDIHLILESELSDRTQIGLRFDFEKLLISKSELKVFFCLAEGNYNNPDSVLNVLNFLRKSIKSYKKLEENERVVVMIWDDYNTGLVYPFLLNS